MARPPKKPADRRTAYIRIPVTASEKRRITRQAKRAGLTTAAWMRQLAAAVPNT